MIRTKLYRTKNIRLLRRKRIGNDLTLAFRFGKHPMEVGGLEPFRDLPKHRGRVPSPHLSAVAATADYFGMVFFDCCSRIRNAVNTKGGPYVLFQFPRERD